MLSDLTSCVGHGLRVAFENLRQLDLTVDWDTSPYADDDDDELNPPALVAMLQMMPQLQDLTLKNSNVGDGVNVCMCIYPDYTCVRMMTD